MKERNKIVETSVDSVNKKTMSEVVKEYSVVPGTWSDRLTRAEQAALNAIADEVRDKRLLDLGVGAGRTVRAMREISRDYIGIDYVDKMVAECRRHFPGVRFEQADARDLSIFGDSTFSLIAFFCNGISMVDHEGRIAILKEAYRLLAPGGALIFSTFNQDTRYNAFFKFPSLQFAKNPLRQVVRIMRFICHTGIRMFNRARFIRFEQKQPSYSILNTAFHNYATLNYYISLESQFAQLESVGFQKGTIAFDPSGQIIAGNVTDDDFIFLARK